MPGSVGSCVLSCADRASECLRAVKLAETARVAHRFSWLHRSSLSEEWLRTMSAMLPSGLDSLCSLPPCLSLSLSPLYFPRFPQFYPNFTHSYTPLSCSLSPGNTMMIVVESMSNGALDSFLRVSLFVCLCMYLKFICMSACLLSNNKIKPQYYYLPLSQTRSFVLTMLNSLILWYCPRAATLVLITVIRKT